MHHFSVWAPRAKVVRVEVNGTEHSMRRGRNGWWWADVAEAGHGSDYAFLLNDDPHPYPDPRSEWQPHGVHAVSRVLDHARYYWRESRWSPAPLSRAVIYELHIGTFTSEGTFLAAERKLEWLRDLGITHVELMPVNSFPGRWGWGYDGVALYAPQEQYGGPEALKSFVDACHGAGLAVLLDVVYNHFGPAGNYTRQFGPYITRRHRTPWGGGVKLQGPGSAEVRRFFCDNALMWLRDYHFDGLRLDAVHVFIDQSAPHFLEQLATEVGALSQRLGRELILIAESDWNDPSVVLPVYHSTVDHSTEGNMSESKGFGMDAQWSDDFHHALFAYLSGERTGYYRDFGSLSQLGKSLISVFVYDGLHSEYRGRAHGRPAGEISAHRFLGYIQNHDQIGNRAAGDRLHTIVGLRRARLAAALTLTAPFVPMIFQGEEFASSSPFLYFTDHEDPKLAAAVSEGRRRDYADGGTWDLVPDPGAEETFLQSKLRWEESPGGDHALMLEWYRSLIHLRRSYACLRNGDLTHINVEFDEEKDWLIMRRGAMHLFFNFSLSTVTFPLPTTARLCLSTEPDINRKSGSIALPAESFAAWIVDPELEG